MPVIIITAAVALTLGASKIAKSIIILCNHDEFREEIDEYGRGDLVVEPTTCLIETNRVTTTAAMAQHLPVCGIVANFSNQSGDGAQETSEELVASNLIMPGPDGNISTGVAIYQREKIKVTNHRRVLYRKRNNFMHSIVAEIKLKGMKERTPAHELTVRHMLNDRMEGINIADRAIILPIALELCFIPTDVEIRAADLGRSSRAKERRNRLSKKPGLTLRRCWRAITGTHPEDQPLIESPLLPTIFNGERKCEEVYA